MPEKDVKRPRGPKKFQDVPMRTPEGWRRGLQEWTLEDDIGPSYPHLGLTFLNGNFPGQLKSAEDGTLDKQADFLRAVVDGVIGLGDATARYVARLRLMADKHDVDISGVLMSLTPEQTRPVAVAERAPKVKEVRRWPRLSGAFFTGKAPGQVASIYRTFREDPDRLAQYREALECGVLHIPIELVTPALRKKIVEMNLEQFIA